ncbi:hypothetical protein WJ542_31055 [Paraburkholderia sp. B3]|uniref:hypothetical protein n=1 Tax=Paraburkholderia sp. B3 TaxID=3134791 RepID=UPI0039823308
MIKRGLCLLLFVLAALCISATATAGRGWFRGGGHYGGYGGYRGVNHSSGWNGGYRGGGWYHGGYYGWYHGGYYHGWYGCCGGVNVGFYFGPGFIYGYPFYPYYAPAYYGSVYYPYVSSDLLPPTEYIEQGQPEAGAAYPDDQGAGYPGADDPGPPAQLAVWYYCPMSQRYYPYVQSCPGGWQKVPARPPDS